MKGCLWVVLVVSVAISLVGCKCRGESVELTINGVERSVTFYSERECVELVIDGEVVRLDRYRTGSGFGYANGEYDLRGKGGVAGLGRRGKGL